MRAICMDILIRNIIYGARAKAGGPEGPSLALWSGGSGEKITGTRAPKSRMKSEEHDDETE